MANENAQDDDSQIRALLLHTPVADKNTAETRQWTGEAGGSNEFAAHVHVTGTDVAIGGGTEYTEGATDATITGTAIMWEDSGDTLRAVSAAKPLPIGDGGGSITVDGTVTVNEPVSVDDNGGSLTVDAVDLDIRPLVNTDVVTAELSAVDNAVLDAIAASVAAIDTDTTTIIGHVDGIEGLLTTIDTDTGAMVTDLAAIEVLLTTIEGNQLPDGHNVTIDNPGDIGGGTEYTVNAVAPSDPVGKAIVVERDDALSALTEIEGDWTNLRGTAEGALWTQDFNSDAILADTTSIKTAVEIIDNAIAGTEMQVDVVAALPAGTNIIGSIDHIESYIKPGTDGDMLGKQVDQASNGDDTGVMVLQKRVESPSEITPEAGDYTQFQSNLNGSTWVAIEDGAGGQITSFGGGTQYTEGDTDASITGTAMLMEGALNTLLPVQGTVADGLLVNLGSNNDVTVTSVTPGSLATNLGKTEDAAHTSGDTGVMMLGVRNEALSALADTNLDYAPIGTDRNGAVILSGIGTTQVIGDIAHDDSDTSSNNPVKIGGRAKSSAPTAVVNDDMVNAYFDLQGYQFTHPVRVISGTNTFQSAVRIDDSPTSDTSSSFDASLYSRGRMFMIVDSTGTSTHELQIIVQYSDDDSTYYDVQESFYGDLRYEDAATATAVNHSVPFPEPLAKYIKTKIVGVNTTSSNYFDVTIKGQFYTQ